MTAIVGVYCNNGAVIGMDSSTTFSHGQFSTIEQQTEKLVVIDGKIIVAGTGSVGAGQRFNQIVEETWRKKLLSGKTFIDAGKILSKAAIEDFQSTYLKHGSYGSLVAFPLGQDYHLCEFDISTFQPEFKNNNIRFCSMGSTQPITDPFLAFIREIFWTDGLPSINDAIFAVTWTLDHAISVNPGGVNGPVRIAVLEKNTKKEFSARILTDAELGEHRENIEELKQKMREFTQPYVSDSKIESSPTPPIIQK